MSKILITGANGGFGALTVKTLLKQGHSVVATMRNTSSKNKEAAQELESLGAKIGNLDVTDNFMENNNEWKSRGSQPAIFLEFSSS